MKNICDFVMMHNHSHNVHFLVFNLKEKKIAKLTYQPHQVGQKIGTLWRNQNVRQTFLAEPMI